MEVFLKLIILWILYFIIHSIFASNHAKKVFKRYFPFLNQYYRAIYVFCATLGLLLIFMYQSTLPQWNLYIPNTIITFVGLSLATLGLIIVKESFSQYDTQEFLGIRQIKGDLNEQGFQRQGLLAYIRHPLYSGSILLLVGYVIFAPKALNLITASCMILYFMIGSYFEERRLIEAFGGNYLKYKNEVPAFIPHFTFLKKKGKKGKN